MLLNFEVSIKTMSNRITYFEIPSSDPEKNMKFFEEVFNWKFEQFGNEEYWHANTGDDSVQGINGAVMKEISTKQPVINTISVVDINEAIENIKSAGGRIVKSKRAIPLIGWLAFFTDPDENIFGIMQEDKNAK